MVREGKKRKEKEKKKESRSKQREQSEDRETNTEKTGVRICRKRERAFSTRCLGLAATDNRSKRFDYRTRELFRVKHI
jgi:hypothetical protein